MDYSQDTFGGCLRYAIIDLDICGSLPTITLDADQDGIAFLLRREGSPVAFFLQSLEPSTTLGPGELDRLIGRSAALSVLGESLRVELSTQTQQLIPRTLTVAICTRARVEFLVECLKSLLRLRDASNGAKFDILVVDNAPPDESTRHAVQALQRVRYVREDKPGLDFARNRALSEAKTDFVAFLDDDVEADSGWLLGFQEALIENPDAAAITGLVLPYELETEAQVIFERRGGFRRGFAKRRYKGSSRAQSPLYPAGAGIFGAGCNMVLHRQIALELKGFDEALDTGASLPGGGDIDIFYRVIRAGNPLVYEPRMLVFHKHRRELEKLRSQYWSWGTGFMAFVTKSYAADPPQRSKLRRLVLWWLGHQLVQLQRSTQRQGDVTPVLAIAELMGGVVGLAGTYRRSVRRIDDIRRKSK
jgi:glycosyltransferase involved in cell wall biosynthesis